MEKSAAFALTALLLAAATSIPMAASAPAISSISAGTDDTNGGRTAVIFGTGFQSGLQVRIGDRPGVVSGAVEETSFNVILPPRTSPGAVDVLVTNPDGTSTTFGGGVTYTAAPAPTLSKVGPQNSGNSTGGKVLVLEGANFPLAPLKAYRPRVAFGGVPADVLSGDGSTLLTVRTPAHPPGTVDVVVTNPDGKSHRLAGGFTFGNASAPKIDSLGFAEGTSLGGDALNIHGANISPSATVTIGGQHAFVLQPASDDCKKTCVVNVETPAHAPGRVDVVLQNPDGKSATRTGAYLFRAARGPTLEAPPPLLGPTTGGTLVCLDGAGFSPWAKVHVGGAPATDVHAKHPDDLVDDDCDADDLSFVTPPHAAGTVDIVITNPDGQTTRHDNGFTYSEPVRVVSATPATANCNGGTTVTLAGTGLAAGSQAFFNGRPAISSAGKGASLAAVIPSADCALPPANVEISVLGPDGRQARLSGALRYDPAVPPSLAASDWVQPATGSAMGGLAATVRGAAFHVGPEKPRVWFGGVEAAVGQVTANSIAVVVPTMPAGTSGAVDVVVENPGGQRSQASKPFLFTEAAAPGVGRLKGAVATSSNGGLQAILEAPGGKPFASGANATGTLWPKVCVGDGGPDPACSGGHLAKVTSVQPTALHFVTPPIAGGAGPMDVYVINPDGQVSAPSETRLDYSTAPPPAVTARTPDRGSTMGWTPVTISGSGFAAGLHHAEVLVAGTAIKQAVVGPNSISFAAPASPAGPVTLVVRNPDGQTAEVGTFLYEAGTAPAVDTIAVSGSPLTGGAVVAVQGRFPNVEPASAPWAIRVGDRFAEYRVTGPTSLLVTLPGSPAGVVDLTVTNLDGQSASRAQAIRYWPEPLSGLQVTTDSPRSGPAHGGTWISVDAAGLDRRTSAHMGDKAVADLDLDQGRLLLLTPALSPGPTAITLSDAFGQTVTRAAAFKAVDTGAPAIWSLVHGSGPSQGGTVTAVIGAGFAPDARVEFGSLPADPDKVLVSPDGSWIILVTPSHEMGVVAVSVTNPDGKSDLLPAAFGFLGPNGTLDQLAIASVSPETGPIAGGTPVTVRGTGFGASATVQVGGLNATQVTFVNSTTLTLVTPAHAAGPADIVVTVGGKSVSRPGAFTFVTPTAQPTPTGAGQTETASPPVPIELTPNQIRNANLQVKVTVSRVGQDNVISWEVPDLLPAGLAGVQVWRSNSPYALVATLESNDTAFSQRTYRDTGLAALETTRYAVTLYYGAGVAAGRFGAQGPSTQDYPGVSSLDVAPEGGGQGLPWAIMVYSGLGILTAVLAGLLVVWWRRRRAAAVAREAAGPAAYTWQSGPAVGSQLHQAKCPSCGSAFTVAGTRPLATACPGCGTKGTLA